MRCICCNSELSDFEATRKHKTTHKYLDMCGKCATSLPSSVLSTNDKLLLACDSDTMDTYEAYIDLIDYIDIRD